MIESRLINWAKWVRDGKPPKQHCGSIEHRRQPYYTPPESAQIEWLYTHKLINADERQSMYDDLPKPRPSQLNATDAILVERGVCLMEGEKHRKLLKYHYVKRWPNIAIAHKLRLYGEFQTFLQVALNDIQTSLNNIEIMMAVGMYPTMHNLIPPSAKDAAFADL